MASASERIERVPRDESERTRVWYGNIGSGNSMMRNPRRRDMLRDEYNLIGLEIEAAGVMNILPTGVIRGVCAYGDGQKNKDWQPYAAAIVAVYAKGILCTIKPKAGQVQTTVVDAAKRNSAKFGGVTVYYYCENEQRDMLKAFDLLASFVKQLLWYLARIHKRCPAEAQEQIWKFFGTKRTQPDFDDLADIVISLSKHTVKTIYIIDGLDELDGKEVEKVLRVVHELFGSKTEQNGSRIAIFSRDQIAPYLKVLRPDTIHISTSNNIGKDLQLYIETVLEGKTRVRELTSDRTLMEETKQKLSEGASGMFLWVYLQVEALWDTCSTDGEIRQAIENLLKDLEETYHRCLQRINRGRQYTPKVLKWVRDAVRPLHIDELGEAVAFDVGDKAWDPDKVPGSASLIGCCANLVVQDTTDQCVRFAHPSVRQFLKSNQGDNNLPYPADPTQGVLNCGEFCVAYLSFSDFGLQIERNSDTRLSVMPQDFTATQNFSGVGAIVSTIRRAIAPTPDQQKKPIFIRLPPKPTTIANRERYKFLQYAVANWATQTKMITRQSAVWDLFKQLAINPNKTWNFHPWVSSGQSQASHLHGILGWAVKEQHKPLLDIVLASESRNSAKNFFDAPVIGGSLPALHVASRLGFEDVIKLLLRVCAVNKADGEGYTALHHSAEKGYVKVTRLLSDAKGVKVDILSNHKRTPLSLAAINGHDQTVSLLIGKRARFKDKDGDGQKPLWWTFRNGHEAVVRLLLETGKVDADTKGNGSKTLLWWAAYNGHEAIVKLLLKTGKVNANAKSDDGQTPLWWATWNGHEAVVELLLWWFGTGLGSRSGD